MNLDKICKLAAIDRFGAWDYAVPIDWLMQDPEKNRPHVWYYPEHGKPRSLFGRPLKWRAIGRLALRVMRAAGIPELDDWLRTWAFVYPGKSLDLSGIAAVKRYIENSSHIDRFNIGMIIEYYQIPAPPPGSFDPPALSQAA